jgi:hypothetical protein
MTGFLHLNLMISSKQSYLIEATKRDVLYLIQEKSLLQI